MNKDVTFKTQYSEVDDECLSITKCVCGKTFPSWTFIISIYEDMPTECPEYKRKLFFRNSITVYEVT